jgi:hypothetical protein
MLARRRYSAIKGAIFMKFGLAPTTLSISISTLCAESLADSQSA